MGGMHAGAVHGSIGGGMRGLGAGHMRPGGHSSLGNGIARHPGSVLPPHYHGDGGWPYYGYGAFGLGFGLYDYGFAYDDPWWGVPGPDFAGPPVADLPDSTDEIGGIRLDVKPKSAEVFVDGARAGVVDDFDGHFQQLKLPAGSHHIELRADGYAPAQFDVQVVAGETLKLHDKMTKG